MQGLSNKRPISALALAVAVCVAAALSMGAVSANAAPAGSPFASASPSEWSYAPSSARAARTTYATSAWGWSAQARVWARTNKVLPYALVARGPAATITRHQFLAALLKIEAMNVDEWDPEPGLMQRDINAPALVDAPAGSAAARAVAAGWMTAPGRRFAGTAPVTGNEAALALAGALGLRTTVVEFALRLRTELPGVRFSSVYASAHALIRILGLRYNVLAPYDRLELGPTDAVNVAHGSWMLNAASRVDDWRLDQARNVPARFDLPTLGANQLKILGTGVRQLGQPYIWAGETEGRQTEGHGGFDCSGFTIRIINQSGVPATQLNPINERTTYTQSAIPAKQRITRAKLQPGDAMFFGNRGPSSTPTQNYHAGVYMGNGWFIHSSGGNGGVAINYLEGYWGNAFSWGRRALRRP